MKTKVINLVNEKRVAKDVVRLSSEENLNSNNGKTASYILKALICEDKDVYIKYIKGNKASAVLNSKLNDIETIMRRMIEEPLSNVCGGEDKVPAKYRGKKLAVLTELPYVQNSVMSKFEKRNDGFVKVQTEADESVVKKAVIVRFRLAVIEEIDLD